MKFSLLVAAVLSCALASPAWPATRSHTELVAFARKNACPSTLLLEYPCAGFVVDHIVPLACGGADHRSNMQWQTIAEGKAKDQWERERYCRPLSNAE